MNNWKAPSVINLMGFAYFASLLRTQKSHGMWKKGAVRKHTQKFGGGAHIKKDVFLQNSLVIENMRISR